MCGCHRWRRSLLECGVRVSEFGKDAKPSWHGRNEVEAIQFSVVRQEEEEVNGRWEVKSAE
jgi:hypothetical protein